MKDKPQLSAEMEKRFDKEFGYLSVAIDYYVENAYPLRKESGMKHLKDIKHFLATALEEQRAEERAKAIGEVEAHYQEMSCTLFDPDYLEGVRASIEIMKGKS